MQLPCEFIEKAKRNLNLNDFWLPSAPIEILNDVVYHIPFERQYVLRMMVRNPASNGFQIPPELIWLRPTIKFLNRIQKENGLNNQFVYVTVRHGLVDSVADDEWHVDGFSMRFPHLPEQNYIWTNNHPTEFLNHSFYIPKAFDPLKHNIHQYFSDNADTARICQTKASSINLIDPYCVHRRPKMTQGIMRTFWRVSFIDVEIEDDTCQQNPLLPVKTYNRKDIRRSLERFKV